MAALADLNLLDLAAEASGQGAPFALGRRLPAMVAQLLRAAGASVRHQPSTVAVDDKGGRGWAVPAGELDEGEAVELSKRLGPARLLAFGQLGPSRREGMTLQLRVLRRGDAAQAAEVVRRFYEEEVIVVVTEVARAIGDLLDLGETVAALDAGAVLGTNSHSALLKLQMGFDGLAALEGCLEGRDGLRTAEHLIDAVEDDRSCAALASSRAIAVLATHVSEELALGPSQRLHELLPTEESVTLLLSRLYQRKGQLPQAAELLERSADLAKGSARLAAELARVYLAQGRFSEAASTCRSVASVPPGPADGELLETTGLALAKEGRVAEAEQTLRDAVRVAPERGQAWINLGRCRHLLGQLEEAKEAYGQAKELEPDSWPLAQNEVDLAIEMGEVERAEQLLGTWMRRRPRDAEVALALGELLGAVGKLAEAKKVLLAATEATSDARLEACLGGVLLRMQEIDAAAEHYRKALDLRPDDPALLSNMAMLLSEQGEHADAEALARRATEIDPADQVAAKVLSHIRNKN